MHSFLIKFFSHALFKDILHLGGFACAKVKLSSRSIMNVEVHTRKVLEAVLGVLHAFVLVHSGSLSGLMVVVMGGDFAVS